MALPVLDGNQSATTLSSVVTGGEHIVAHTVVSLGSQAITDMRSAVSGSVVSISNFPASQTISGTVTANLSSTNLNSVTIGIRGAVTASLTNANLISSELLIPNNSNYTNSAVPVGFYDAQVGGEFRVANNTDWPLPVAIQLNGNYQDSVFSGNPLPISGTVTIGSLPRVTFIDGSGTVVTANSAVTLFASSTTRSYLLVQVTTGSAFVNVGATATTVNGINLTAGQGYAWETTIPQGLVSLISTTTSSRWVAKEA
jgi:hypothetical protein